VNLWPLKWKQIRKPSFRLSSHAMIDSPAVSPKNQQRSDNTNPTLAHAAIRRSGRVPAGTTQNQCGSNFAPKLPPIVADSRISDGWWARRKSMGAK
jgi:hypothetical protein